ncbi:MAG: RNA polymerase sigma factor [Verrucomicrobiota bacterium]
MELDDVERDPSSNGTEALAHYDDVFGFLIRRTSQRSEAEDLTQETMFRFFRWQKGREVRDTKRTLFRIAQNLLVDRNRRVKIRVPFEATLEEDLAVTEVNPNRTAEANERFVVLRRAIASMPPRVREVFELNRMQGMRHREIADSLGISKSTVEKHMIRALAICRSALEEDA